MAEVNRRLSEDEQLRQRFEQAAVELCERRDGSPPEQPVQHPGGGPRRVKCLHAHLAQHLVTGKNPVGALVAEKLLPILGDPGAGTQSPCV